MGVLNNNDSSSMHRFLFLLLAGLGILVEPSLARTGRTRSFLSSRIRNAGAGTASESNFRPRRLPWGVVDAKPERSLLVQRISRLPRGGSSKEEEDESEYDSEEEEEEEYDDEEADAEEEEEEEEDSEETESECEEDEESIDAEGVRIEVNVQKFDEPFVLSPLQSIYTTVGVMYLSRKVDFFAPTTVRIIRFAYLAYLVLQQITIFFIRIQARRMNDQTPIELTNPLSSILQNKMSSEDNSNGMMKSLASSLLRSTSTVLEYDLQQTRSMQTGLILNMLMQWFLHFKMEQVQPVVMQTVNGLVQLVYSPLFQVYILGRNLERPFKTAAMMRMEQMKKNAPPTTDDQATEETDDDEQVGLTEEDEEEDDDDDDEEEESEAEEEEMEESDYEEEEAHVDHEPESNDADDDFDEDFSDPE